MSLGPNWPDLASGGLDIEPGQEKRLILYLGRYKPEARLTNVDRLGWIDTTDDQLAFVTPNETLSQSDMEYVFQPERHCPTVSTMRSNGTLKDWKENVAEKCKEKPYLIFSLCLGLSGPLMKPASIDNGGFHLYAQSSQGKTLCAQLSASAWGCGADPAVAPELSYIRRWNSTVNAFEGLAAAHSDNILVLDELGTCSSRDFGGVIYNLASGLGRAAMDRNRNLKAQRIWRNMLLSTGEVSSRSKIEEESVKTSAKAGQLVRLLDIPVSGIVGDEKDPKAFVDQLKLACGQYYGSAGPEFVRQLTAVFESATELRDAVSEFIGASMTRLGASKLRPALERAAKKFALVEVAGILGVTFEILPFTDEEIKSSVRTAYDAWLTEAEAIPDDIRAVLAVRGFILKHRESRFRHQPIRENEPKTIDLCGYFHRTDNFYLFTPAGFKEACTGVESQTGGKET